MTMTMTFGLSRVVKCRAIDIARDGIQGNMLGSRFCFDISVCILRIGETWNERVIRMESIDILARKRNATRHNRAIVPRWFSNLCLTRILTYFVRQIWIPKQMNKRDYRGLRKRPYRKNILESFWPVYAQMRVLARTSSGYPTGSI